MNRPAIEDLTACGGISYRRRHDISYRTGLVLQVLGAAVLAVLYPWGSPFFSAGIMLFELGALISGISLLVWISWVKKIILGAILAGILFQVIGLSAPAEYAGTMLLWGIGLVCVGAAGMAGKEAYCFAYREGWILAWLYPLIIALNLLGRERRVLNALLFSIHFLLLLSLAGKKLKQPLPTSRSTGDCAQREEKP